MESWHAEARLRQEGEEADYKGRKQYHNVCWDWRKGYLSYQLEEERATRVIPDWSNLVIKWGREGNAFVLAIDDDVEWGPNILRWKGRRAGDIFWTRVPPKEVPALEARWGQ